MTRNITEIKHNLNKPDQYFTCCLLYYGNSRVVLSYLASEEYKVGNTLIPPGTLTLGYYEQGLKYVLWKMTKGTGGLIGYYIHLCENLEVSRGHIEYDDQLLDLWFLPDGSCQILDEDELIEAYDNELITLNMKSQIKKSAQEIINNIDTIKTDFDSLLSTLDLTINTTS